MSERIYAYEPDENTGLEFIEPTGNGAELEVYPTVSGSRELITLPRPEVQRLHRALGQWLADIDSVYDHVSGE